jgi:hypothetical protein
MQWARIFGLIRRLLTPSAKNNRYLLAMALVDSDLDAFWDNQSNA